MHIQSCENPKRIFNPYLREFQFVACGRCNTCRTKRAYSWVKRIQSECSCHKYSVFFTLTYSNDFVPYIKFDDDCCYRSFRTTQNFTVDISDFDDLSLRLLDTDRLFVLDSSHIQLFIKRLRSNIYEETKESSSSLRYYIVGEYGPTTFRPHYHGILWFDSERINRVFEKVFVKAWSKYNRACCAYESIGRVDWSYVNSNAAQYVAQYLNCTNNLPSVLTFPAFRPFSLQSRRPPIGSLLESEKQIQEIFYQGLTKISLPQRQGEKPVASPLHSYLKSRLFPKCLRYSTLSHAYRVEVYRLAESVSEDSFAGWSTEARNRLIKRDIFNLLDTTYHTFIFDYLDELSSSFLDFRPIIRAVLISRKVIERARQFGCSLDYYVSRIEKFYDNCEKQVLNSWYEFAEEYSKCHDYNELLCCDLDFVDSFVNSPSKLNPTLLNELSSLSSLNPEKLSYLRTSDFVNMSFLSSKIVKDTSKTKQKNDYLDLHPELKLFSNE